MLNLKIKFTYKIDILYKQIKGTWTSLFFQKKFENINFPVLFFSLNFILKHGNKRFGSVKMHLLKKTPLFTIQNIHICNLFINRIQLLYIECLGIVSSQYLAKMWCFMTARCKLTFNNIILSLTNSHIYSKYH